MKKIFAFILVLALSLSLCACNDKKDSRPSTETDLSREEVREILGDVTEEELNAIMEQLENDK